MNILFLSRFWLIMILVNLYYLGLALICQINANGLNYIRLNHKSLILHRVKLETNLITFFFSLIINNSPSILLHVEILVFANDIKLFINIPSSLDCVKFQTNLDRLISWVQSICHQLNVSIGMRLEYCRHLYFVDGFNAINNSWWISSGSGFPLFVYIMSQITYSENKLIIYVDFFSIGDTATLTCKLIYSINH